MKKYRWNKEKFKQNILEFLKKFTINIKKVQAIGLLALSFDFMFLYAFFK